MANARFASVSVFISVLLGGCVSLAPGADKVQVTKNAADVAACSSLGNITVPRKPEGQVDMGNAETQFRNRAVGLGANTALVTFGTASIPMEGIAYKCP